MGAAASTGRVQRRGRLLESVVYPPLAAAEAYSTGLGLQRKGCPDRMSRQGKQCTVPERTSPYATVDYVRYALLAVRGGRDRGGLAMAMMWPILALASMREAWLDTHGVPQSEASSRGLASSGCRLGIAHACVFACV